MSRAFVAIAAVTLLAGGLTAQSISFTGNVSTDFGPAKLIADPGGLDVGMPAGIGGPACGWEVENVALSHDHTTDTLYVGIDVAGIAGDADGDGDPGGTSSALAASGGVDHPDFGGGETFAIALDLDGDLDYDIIAGVLPGETLSDFRVAAYDDSIAAGQTYPEAVLAGRFGIDLPQHVGMVYGSPNAASPDLEFTITNFSQLMVDYGRGGHSGLIRFEVFLGSLDDQGVGEDQVMNEQPIVVVGPCFPQPNLYENAGLGFNPGGIEVALRYHVMESYGCCTLFSTVLAQIPITLTGLPGAPDVLVGDYGNLASINTIDLGFPDLGGLAVDCKDTVYTIPFSIPSGTEIHAQILAYPAPGIPLPFLTSNTVTYVQP